MKLHTWNLWHGAYFPHIWLKLCYNTWTFWTYYARKKEDEAVNGIFGPILADACVQTKENERWAYFQIDARRW